MQEIFVTQICEHINVSLRHLQTVNEISLVSEFEGGVRARRAYPTLSLLLACLLAENMRCWQEVSASSSLHQFWITTLNQSRGRRARIMWQSLSLPLPFDAWGRLNESNPCQKPAHRPRHKEIQECEEADKQADGKVADNTNKQKSKRGCEEEAECNDEAGRCIKAVKIYISSLNKCCQHMIRLHFSLNSLCGEAKCICK